MRTADGVGNGIPTAKTQHILKFRPPGASNEINDDIDAVVVEHDQQLYPDH